MLTEKPIADHSTGEISDSSDTSYVSTDASTDSSPSSDEAGSDSSSSAKDSSVEGSKNLPGRRRRTKAPLAEIKDPPIWDKAPAPAVPVQSDKKAENLQELRQLSQALYQDIAAPVFPAVITPKTGISFYQLPILEVITASVSKTGGAPGLQLVAPLNTPEPQINETISNDVKQYLPGILKPIQDHGFPAGSLKKIKGFDSVKKLLGQFFSSDSRSRDLNFSAIKAEMVSATDALKILQKEKIRLDGKFFKSARFGKYPELVNRAITGITDKNKPVFELYRLLTDYTLKQDQKWFKWLGRGKVDSRVSELLKKIEYFIRIKIENRPEYERNLDFVILGVPQDKFTMEALLEELHTLTTSSGAKRLKDADLLRQLTDYQNTLVQVNKKALSKAVGDVTSSGNDGEAIDFSNFPKFTITNAAQCDRVFGSGSIQFVQEQLQAVLQNPSMGNRSVSSLLEKLNLLFPKNSGDDSLREIRNKIELIRLEQEFEHSGFGIDVCFQNIITAVNSTIEIQDNSTTVVLTRMIDRIIAGLGMPDWENFGAFMEQLAQPNSNFIEVCLTTEFDKLTDVKKEELTTALLAAICKYLNASPDKEALLCRYTAVYSACKSPILNSCGILSEDQYSPLRSNLIAAITRFGLDRIDLERPGISELREKDPDYTQKGAFLILKARALAEASVDYSEFLNWVQPGESSADSEQWRQYRVLGILKYIKSLFSDANTNLQALKAIRKNDEVRELLSSAANKPLSIFNDIKQQLVVAIRTFAADQGRQGFKNPSAEDFDSIKEIAPLMGLELGQTDPDAIYAQNYFAALSGYLREAGDSRGLTGFSSAAEKLRNHASHIEKFSPFLTDENKRIFDDIKTWFFAIYTERLLNIPIPEFAAARALKDAFSLDIIYHNEVNRYCFNQLNAVKEKFGSQHAEFLTRFECLHENGDIVAAFSRAEDSIQDAIRTVLKQGIQYHIQELLSHQDYAAIQKLFLAQGSDDDKVYNVFPGFSKQEIQAIIQEQALLCLAVRLQNATDNVLIEVLKEDELFALCNLTGSVSVNVKNILAPHFQCDENADVSKAIEKHILLLCVIKKLNEGLVDDTAVDQRVRTHIKEMLGNSQAVEELRSIFNLDKQGYNNLFDLLSPGSPQEAAASMILTCFVDLIREGKITLQVYSDLMFQDFILEALKQVEIPSPDDIRAAFLAVYPSHAFLQGLSGPNFMDRIHGAFPREIVLSLNREDMTLFMENLDHLIQTGKLSGMDQRLSSHELHILELLKEQIRHLLSGDAGEEHPDLVAFPSFLAFSKTLCLTVDSKNGKASIDLDLLETLVDQMGRNIPQLDLSKETHIGQLLNEKWNLILKYVQQLLQSDTNSEEKRQQLKRLEPLVSHFPDNFPGKIIFSSLLKNTDNFLGDEYLNGFADPETRQSADDAYALICETFSETSGWLFSHKKDFKKPEEIEAWAKQLNQALMTLVVFGTEAHKKQVLIRLQAMTQLYLHRSSTWEHREHGAGVSRKQFNYRIAEAAAQIILASSAGTLSFHRHKMVRPTTFFSVSPDSNAVIRDPGPARVVLMELPFPDRMNSEGWLIVHRILSLHLNILGKEGIPEQTLQDIRRKLFQVKVVGHSCTLSSDDIPSTEQLSPFVHEALNQINRCMNESAGIFADDQIVNAERLEKLLSFDDADYKKKFFGCEAELLTANPDSRLPITRRVENLVLEAEQLSGFQDEVAQEIPTAGKEEKHFSVHEKLIMSKLKRIAAITADDIHHVFIELECLKAALDKNRLTFSECFKQQLQSWFALQLENFSTFKADPGVIFELHRRNIFNLVGLDQRGQYQSDFETAVRLMELKPEKISTIDLSGIATTHAPHAPWIDFAINDLLDRVDTSLSEKVNIQEQLRFYKDLQPKLALIVQMTGLSDIKEKYQNMLEFYRSKALEGIRHHLEFADGGDKCFSMDAFKNAVAMAKQLAGDAPEQQLAIQSLLFKFLINAPEIKLTSGFLGIGKNLAGTPKQGSSSAAFSPTKDIIEYILDGSSVYFQRSESDREVLNTATAVLNTAKEMVKSVLHADFEVAEVAAETKLILQWAVEFVKQTDPWWFFCTWGKVLTQSESDGSTLKEFNNSQLQQPDTARWKEHVVIQRWKEHVVIQRSVQNKSKNAALARALRSANVQQWDEVFPECPGSRAALIQLVQLTFDANASVLFKPSSSYVKYVENNGEIPTMIQLAQAIRKNALEAVWTNNLDKIKQVYTEIITLTAPEKPVSAADTTAEIVSASTSSDASGLRFQ